MSRRRVRVKRSATARVLFLGEGELRAEEDCPSTEAVSLLEVFDAALYTQHIAPGLSFHRVDKGLRHALGMDAAPEAIHS